MVVEFKLVDRKLCLIEGNIPYQMRFQQHTQTFTLITIQIRKHFWDTNQVFYGCKIVSFRKQHMSRSKTRLMTISRLYPCGKPCSRGTHNETVKNIAQFSSIINGIMMESRLRVSIPWECFKFFNRNENFITFTP